MNIFKPTAIVIVDFDNFFRMNDPKFTHEIVEFDFKSIVQGIADQNDLVEDIQIRLYGGWYQGDVFTNNASVLQQMLSNIDVFPYINSFRKVSGSIEVVSSLLDVPDFIWTSTYKEKHGIGRVRLKRELLSQVCDDNQSICAPKILDKFTKSPSKICRVEGCSNIHSHILKGMEQKMVDTIMACDIVSCGQEELVVEVVVVSDDTDLLPSVISLQRNTREKKRVTLLNRKPNVFNKWSPTLNQFGVYTKLIES